VEVEALEHFLLNACGNTIAGEHAIGHDDGGATRLASEGALQLARDELEEEKRRLGGLFIGWEVVEDPALFFAAKRRVGEDNIHAIGVADFRNLHREAVAIFNVWVEPGEAEALLQHAGPHLRDCIVTALETGMRKGEILSLQWQHVRWMQNEIAVHWENTKTKHSRRIPISVTLREVLVGRQKALPEGQKEWKQTDFVFGDAVGGRVKDIRTAWDNTVLKAHGVRVSRGHAGRVSAENRARLREIDLNFHDLRHEAGSRKLESGWQLHDVALWLGHSKITTTSTYLNASTQRLHELNERVPLTLVKG
jgi:integrase